MEIKCRGKRTDNEAWVIGQYVNCQWPENKSRTGHFISKYPGTLHEIYTDSLCQFIGIDDKDQTSIFEKDVVLCTWYGQTESGPVQKYSTYVLVNSVTDVEALKWLKRSVKLTVIGNVIDDPELELTVDSTADSKKEDDEDVEMPLVCLRCGKEIPMKPSVRDAVSYTHYSYCEDCLKEGLKLLKDADREKKETEPFWILSNGLKPQKNEEGKVYAFPSQEQAMAQIEETESLMSKNGHSGLTGILFPVKTSLRAARESGYMSHDFFYMGRTVHESSIEENEDHKKGRHILIFSNGKQISSCVYPDFHDAYIYMVESYEGSIDETYDPSNSWMNDNGAYLSGRRGGVWTIEPIDE